MKVIPETHRVH